MTATEQNTVSASPRRRRFRPIWFAVLFVAGVAAWMASGQLVSSEDKQTAAATAEKKPVTPNFTVAVMTLRAKPITRFILVQGHLKPNRTVTLRAETPGRVVEVVATKGQRVKAGQVIVRLEAADRMAKLEHAKAKVVQTERDLEAARKLMGKGFQTDSNLKTLAAVHESAKANLKAMQVDIDRLTIRAPFDGVLNERAAEMGGYVATKDEVATIVDDNPVLAIAEVAQQNVARLKIGGKALVGLINGKTVEGRIRYISAQADDDTRTFRTEIEIPNPGRANIAGSTAQIRIPVEALKAHFMSAQFLTLDDDGALGIKSVGPDGKVAFHGIEVVRAESDGVWVSGLPDTVRLIV
ncbi:MAG: efflux RND transporter periplasmic adaptor subunit, partial [Bauldia litoralis]